MNGPLPLRTALSVLAFVAMTMFGAPAQAQARLMMVEQAGCTYCAAWHAEVGPEYPATAEGKSAPLLLQDLRAPLPENVSLKSPPVFTPTFILLQNGVEVARLEGYPSEDFFWPLLANMLKTAGIAAAH
jgi:hypothetical protein